MKTTERDKNFGSGLKKLAEAYQDARYEAWKKGKTPFQQIFLGGKKPIRRKRSK